MAELTREYFDHHPGVILEAEHGGLTGKPFLVKHRREPEIVKAALQSFPAAALSGKAALRDTGKTTFQSLLFLAGADTAKDATIMNNVLEAIIQIW